MTIADWVARYSGAGRYVDRSQAMTVDTMGNVYVAGYHHINSGTASEYVTIKYNSSGVVQWMATYSLPGTTGGGAEAVAVDALGNVYVTGYSAGTGGLSDYATIKYDSSGAEQWVARYDGPGHRYDGPHAVAVDSLGNVCVSGVSNGSGTGEDLATIRYVQSFPSTLIITTETLGVGSLGAPYAEAVWAFGGSGGRTWSISTGSLPPGLDLSPTTGIISGTPTSPGTYGFTVKVVDGTLSATKDLSITYPTISGQVRSILHLAGGDVYFPITGVIIHFSGGAGTATTDSSGNYVKTVGLGWTGTVVPSISYGIYHTERAFNQCHWARIYDPGDCSRNRREDCFFAPV